jgi:hypothetical protein
MKFKRHLKSSFVDELNRLYEIKGSWWQKMADDEDAFILIRNNRVHVLVNGGLLLRIRIDARNKMICETHEEFLSLRSEKKPYLILDKDSTEPIQRVQGLNGLTEHYPKVKRRIKLFTGKEKQVVQQMALKFQQIIDLEVGIEGDIKEGALKKGAQRVDMAGISDKGALVFFEVKLFDNSEVRSRQTPKVVGQLKKYKKLLEKYRSEILLGYEDQYKMYQELKGRFFKNRLRNFEIKKVYPNVRLILTDFDSSQKDFLLPTILKGICRGMAWGDKTADLITIGNHSNLKKVRLFKSI